MEIKICGITNAHDALFAASLGVDALGFIFYPASLRYISPKQAKEIIQLLPQNICTVGVFVNEELPTIKEIEKFCHLDYLQFHGKESKEFCRLFPKGKIIKAISPEKAEDLENLRDFPAQAILVDAQKGADGNSTGKTAPWELAKSIKDHHPLILAGGLREDNIVDAIRAVSPDAVDINSGVEVAPGKKDLGKMERIIRMIRELEISKKKKIFVESRKHEDATR